MKRTGKNLPAAYPARIIARLDKKIIANWKWQQDNFNIRNLPTLRRLHGGDEFGDRMMASNFGVDVDTIVARRRALMPPEFAIMVAEIRPLMKPIHKAIKKHNAAQRKRENAIEKAAWEKAHPQWSYADFERVRDSDSETPGFWHEMRLWQSKGTPMTAEALGPPTRPAERDSEVQS